MSLSVAIANASGEDPVSRVHTLEVFLLDPGKALVRVPMTAPVPHHAKNSLIHFGKSAFTGRVTVIHRPTLDLLIQTVDHYSRRHAAGLVNRFLDLGQERLHAPL